MEPEINNGQESGSTSENVGQPTPQFSEDGNTPTSNQTVPTFENGIPDEFVGAFVEKLLGHQGFQEALGRTVQSQKDKRFNRLSGEISDVQSKVAGLDIEALQSYQKHIESGKTPEDAINTMKLETLFKQFAGQEQQPINNQSVPVQQKPQGSGDSEWTAAQQTLLKAFGVSENDPDLVNFIGSKKFANSGQYIKELTTFLANKPQPTGIPVQSGSTMDNSNTATREAQLYQQYKAEKAKIPRGHAAVGASHTLLKHYRDAYKFDPEAYEAKNGLYNI